MKSPVRFGLWLLLTCCLGGALAAAASARPSRHRPPVTRHAGGIREIPVSFSVINSNTSLDSCRTDGHPYTIAGTLLLPAGATPSGVTLYAHGLGYGAYFWHFTAVPGYDYAGSEAAAGHASVIIDRLGYGASGKPDGNASCLGGQATVLHEIVQELRHGSFAATGLASAPHFSRVGLVGHSIGGEIVEIEAYSFHDVNALGVMDFADGDFSPAAYATFGADAAHCLTGGQPAGPGGPGGYSPFGATTADYDSVMFAPADTDPTVETAANRLRSLDPCGDITSTLAATTLSVGNVHKIDVPVAYVWGQNDALFPGPLPWAQLQEALYTGSPKVTNFELPGSGHAVTLERTAPLLIRDMDGWLSANGL
ncbi:MAG TPA: alpha/beta hydrolase [Solirubrobacteraceae bacterium]|nr:alpha/beta hydrolase [Solirubrobacteraceae bacterium]